MLSPAEAGRLVKQKVKPQWRAAFWSVLILGLLIHLPMMVRDIPNHDGLASMYFDQNMITSGRWFLTVACGISSYYTLPWLIGLLSLLYLGLAGAALAEFLEIKSSGTAALVGGLLVSFPALASGFAYVFTLDGYMLGLLLAVLAPLLTRKLRFGPAAGALCLALSMGIYQAYVAFAALLCLYGVGMAAMSGRDLRAKLRESLRYLEMGVLGAAGYYGMLRLLLWIQGKELASYQGIDQAGEGGGGLSAVLGHMYTDFAAFTLKGRVLINNGFSLAALALLGIMALGAVLGLARRKKWWKSIWFFAIMGVMAAGIPVASNLILAVSPQVTYHLLMRYQWVLFPILLTAFVSRWGGGEGRWGCLREWGLLAGAGILIFNFAVTDNIAYSNLQKKYEKTYAYCLRLLDRIEQTEGYYRGIPIAMVGVVGDEPYPLTDITGKVTGGMIGMSGDQLLYTGSNYQAFMQHYLGATLNFLPADAMAEMYYSPEYREMESFPGKDSIRIIDGILYVKTENREEGEE